MIDNTKTAEAMINVLIAFVDDYNANKPTGITQNLVLVADGEAYTPSINETYIEEKLLSNADFPIGIARPDSDIQRPIYQVKVFSPKHEFKWPNIELSMLIKKQFHKMRESINNGEQVLTVESIEASPLMTLETTHCTVLSVNLSVIATNT